MWQNLNSIFFNPDPPLRGGGGPKNENKIVLLKEHELLYMNNHKHKNKTKSKRYLKNWASYGNFSESSWGQIFNPLNFQNLKDFLRFWPHFFLIWTWFIFQNAWTKFQGQTKFRALKLNLLSGPRRQWHTGDPNAENRF